MNRGEWYELLQGAAIPLLIVLAGVGVWWGFSAPPTLLSLLGGVLVVAAAIGGGVLLYRTTTPEKDGEQATEPGADGTERDRDRTKAETGGTETTIEIGAGTETGRSDTLTDQDPTRRPPDAIPDAPEIAVEYDSLTDREPIGEGGNADVWKAVMPTPDGDVPLAIKEPRMSGTLQTEAVERLLDEAETWDKLDGHDHIVGIVDYGSEPLPWIAMEYMDGGHLGTRCGELEADRVRWTAIAVTEGVLHAHRRGVVHLDLKPENILFRTVEGAWDVPKVADWGLSKHLLEQSTSVEGLSPQYAAPEQFDDDHGPVDGITDIYQLGAVFYELFTGRPPFEGTPTEVMEATLHDRPTPPSELADVPGELDGILLTALATEREDRYDDILYLRDDLQELDDR